VYIIFTAYKSSTANLTTYKIRYSLFKIQLQCNYIVKARHYRQKHCSHASVKFEILGFLSFYKVFFFSDWRKGNIQNTCLSVSFTALYPFVYFHYTT